MIGAVAVVAVIVAVIIVGNTILMRVYERTGEIGVMKAIGAHRSDIFELIWLETLAICGTGGTLGSLLALLGARMVEAAIRLLINRGGQGSIVSISPSLIGGSLLGSIFLGLFVSGAMAG